VPNFVAIGLIVVEISRFWIFPDGGSHNLGFLKFYIFNDPNGQEGRIASLCQIWSKSLKPRRRYVSFRFFKMAAAAMLDFWNFKFLTVGTVKRVELHHRAKFRQNRSNRGWDVIIFQFFQDGGRPPSWICDACVGTTHEEHLVVFITVQNLVGIGAVVLIIYTFFDFASFAWKRLFTPQNCFFLWFSPLNGEQCEKVPKKAHPCASPRRLSHHAWKSVDVSDL